MPEQYIEVARTALFEITAQENVAAFLGELRESDGSITLSFASALPGYVGWLWTVSLAHLPGDNPTVLELELLPGDGALLAPDWVPWSERLAEYLATQEAPRAVDQSSAGDDAEGLDDDGGLDDAGGLDADSLDDDDDDDDDDLDDELDEDDLPGGDVDGVDIDALDDTGDDDEDNMDDAADAEFEPRS